MENNNNLTIGFEGSASINGQPMYNSNGIRTIGAYQDSTDTQVAYFGRVASVVPATDKYSYFMGAPGSSNLLGVLLNEQSVRENDPAKPDFVLSTLPATILYWGEFWLPSWTKTAAGAIDPVIGAVVIFKNTTGQIEFLASGQSAPAGWTALNASVSNVDQFNLGALIFIGISNVTLSPVLSNNAKMQLFSIPVTPFIASITDSTGAIAITVPNGTVVTALKAQFVVTEGAVVKIGVTAQVSGTTANDFTNPVVYVVTAPDDATTKTYTVTVTVAP